MRRRKKRTVKRRVRAPAVKIIKGKRYLLTKFAFTNSPAAKKTARALKKHPRVKGVKIARKGRVYLIYVRIK